ncbi:MAG: UDP-N-acetylmuramate:L-alanyl-gamma-D-glutamyl-meso-diaminopimelate ligase [Proteobacteria bacterium]|nr:UDP-N-acetylmuramate:L-alanyl-gamma-D-glutamyl-meso-diaminopimelate ligase [Pseudomonadota bacterium]
MAPLAVLLKNRGHRITGSDQNIYPPMSDLLAENGIDILTPYRAENLQPSPDCVVLGNVLSRGNPEVEYALEARLHYLSSAELLKNEFIRGNRSVVISGTHGKTTTSAMAAHILASCGKPTGFFVSGIPENFGTSSRDIEKGGYFVIEGDEYDTSLFDKRSKFFHYLPERLIVNNIEFDHADIYKDIDEIKKSFSLMLRQIPKNGLIIVNGDDPDAMDVARSGFTPFLSFGTGQDCDAVIANCRPVSGKLATTFDLNVKGKTHHLEIPMMGEFNVRNATSVVLLALHEGIHIDEIGRALASFKSVRRRLQQLTRNTAVRVFDDFAHHPTAISETLKALRRAWPGSRIRAVYEVRSATSIRRCHQDRMADAFSDADTVVMYSKLHNQQRIQPEDRLDLDSVVEELRRSKKEAQLIDDLDGIVENCEQTAREGDIFIVMSNGGFGGIQHRIAAKMDERC